jgi:hypothetical protein
MLAMLCLQYRFLANGLVLASNEDRERAVGMLDNNAQQIKTSMVLLREML